MLCCVDKQGILSWPNPSPETVLFFSGKVEPPHDSHEDLTDEISTRSFCHPEMEDEVSDPQSIMQCAGCNHSWTDTQCDIIEEPCREVLCHNSLLKDEEASENPFLQEF